MLGKVVDIGNMSTDGFCRGRGFGATGEELVEDFVISDFTCIDL